MEAPPSWPVLTSQSPHLRVLIWGLKLQVWIWGLGTQTFNLYQLPSPSPHFITCLLRNSAKSGLETPVLPTHSACLRTLPKKEGHSPFSFVLINTQLWWISAAMPTPYTSSRIVPPFRGTVGNSSKCGKCGSAPTRKSQWGARLVGRTHIHG